VTNTEVAVGAPRGRAERRGLAPEFVLWARASEILLGIWRALMALPDRGPTATPDDAMPDDFRSPPF
jgi:hypothetical protein